MINIPYQHVWRWLLSGLLLLTVFCTQAQSPAPRIGVATMQPGVVFFERFGHDAIVVMDPTSGRATSYNFGYFDPTESDFLARFARGEMMYYLVALPLHNDLAQYRDSGRGVKIQWLDLPDAQAITLANSLAERSRPENARYRYDYFTANCATMVRDSLNHAMAGALQTQLQGRSHGNTYRSEAVRLASPASWMWLGFDLGLGPYADQILSQWQQAFVPMQLAESLTHVYNSEGRPLVQATEQILPHQLDAEPQQQQRHYWPWLLTGAALAALTLVAARRPRLLAACALPFWLLCALAGSVLIYLWGFSDHRAAWGNQNLLLLNPLCLALAVGAANLLRKRHPGRWFSILLWSVPACGIIALLAHWISPQPQYNLQWIAVLLPLHSALALTMGRSRREFGGKG